MNKTRLCWLLLVVWIPVAAVAGGIDSGSHATGAVSSTPSSFFAGAAADLATDDRPADLDVVGVPLETVQSNIRVAESDTKDLWRRRLLTNRFRWRNVGDTFGKGEHSFDWVAVPVEDPAKVQTGLHPQEKAYKQRESKKKCSDLGCFANPGEYDPDCRWRVENVTLFEDYSAGGEFCQEVELGIDFWDVDIDWIPIANKILDIVPEALQCFGLANSGSAPNDNLAESFVSEQAELSFDAQTTYIAQGFKAQEALDVTRVSALLKRVSGAPTGEISAAIYSDSAGKPGAALTGAGFSGFTAVQAADLDGDFRWHDFELSPASSLPAGDYHLVLQYSNTAADQLVGVRRSTNQGYSHGALHTLAPGTSSDWVVAAAEQDMSFRIYTESNGAACPQLITSIQSFLNYVGTPALAVKRIKNIGRIENRDGLGGVMISPQAGDSICTDKKCESCRSDPVFNTIRSGNARVESSWLLHKLGQSAAFGGAAACVPGGLFPLTGSSLSRPLKSCMYGQISSSELRFFARRDRTNLLDPGALQGTREFVFAVDADNNPATGAPAEPLRGAECYVSVLQSSDGADFTSDPLARLYCFLPCDIAKYSPAPAAHLCEPHWTLQSHVPYNLAIGIDEVAVTADLRRLGNPQGFVSSWSIVIENGVVLGTCPDDSSITRLQIERTPDTVCPYVKRIDVEQLAAGNSAAPIRVELSEPMLPPSPAQVLVNPSVPITATLYPSDRMLEIRPVGRFPPGNYQVTLLGTLKDLEGNLLDGYEFDDQCGDSYGFSFCVPDPNFKVIDGVTKLPRAEFGIKQPMLAVGSGFTPLNLLRLYLVDLETIDEGGKILVDRSDNGADAVMVNASGGFTAGIGGASSAGEYTIVADLDGDGIYDAADRAVNACDMGIAVGPPCESIFDDIIAWWPFDETAGAVAVELIAGNHGLYRNGPTPASGIIRGAIRFDGVDDYLEVPNDPELDVGTGDLTIETWILLESSAPQHVGGAIVNKLDDTKHRGYRLNLNVTGGAKDGLTFWMGSALWHSTGTLSRDTWHHIAVSVARGNPNGGIFFIDGAPAGNFDPRLAGGNQYSEVSLLIGRFDGFARPYFQGYLDDLAIHAVALSQAEVKRLYDGGRPANPWLVSDYGKCLSFIEAITMGNAEVASRFEISITLADGLGGHPLALPVALGDSAAYIANAFAGLVANDSVALSRGILAEAAGESILLYGVGLTPQMVRLDNIPPGLGVSLSAGAPPAGDLTGDRAIGMDDFLVIRRGLGKCGKDAGFVVAADFDADGCLTFIDYQAWYALYSRSLNTP